MYEQDTGSLEPAVYVDQRKPRKKRAAHPQKERDDEPDEIAEDEDDEQPCRKAFKVSASEASAQGPIKKSKAKKGNAKQKPEPKTKKPKAKAEPKTEKPKAKAEPKAKKAVAEVSEPPRTTVEEADDLYRDLGDATVEKLAELSMDELRSSYGAVEAPAWVSLNNVYSNAYRKATDRAKLTKQQAQLRARAATAIWRRQSTPRMMLRQLCASFTKPRTRKQKAEPETAGNDPEIENEQGGLEAPAED